MLLFGTEMWRLKGKKDILFNNTSAKPDSYKNTVRRKADNNYNEYFYCIQKVFIDSQNKSLTFYTKFFL
jgi:hypothetical protein